MIEYAWQRSLQLRCCPPLSVLVGGGELVRRHLAICENCRSRLELRDALSVPDQQLMAVNVPPAAERAVRAGDIRNVQPFTDPAEYFDAMGTYFNPPTVLVLDDGPDAAGLVRVAQLFEEEELAFDGDIRLDENSLFYAESWNIYGMYYEHLSSPFAFVTQQLAADILRSIDKPRAALEVNSPLFIFRQCELATGSFFALQSVMYALDRLEAQEADGNPAPALHELRLPAWSMQGVEPMTETFYEMAAADGARSFEDKKNGITVRLYPGKIELHSGSPRTTVGVQFADSQGHVVLVHGVDLGRDAREAGKQFEHEILVSRAPDNVASFVPLRPGNRVTVRPMGEHTPERVLLRVLTPSEV